jgi:hypothetical protein
VIKLTVLQVGTLNSMTPAQALAGAPGWMTDGKVLAEEEESHDDQEAERDSSFTMPPKTQEPPIQPHLI